LSFSFLCAVGGANVACNVFVTVGDTLLLLHVLDEYVDAHLAGGGEEVPRLPERLVERMSNFGVLVTDFAGRDALERVDELGEVGRWLRREQDVNMVAWLC
jgi:precorrin-6B methylase 2